MEHVLRRHWQRRNQAVELRAETQDIAAVTKCARLCRILKTPVVCKATVCLPRISFRSIAYRHRSTGPFCLSRTAFVLFR